MADQAVAGKTRPADVRAALITAAAELIEAMPESEVSLRACARRAGVSHAAPAHYFPTRADLMAACLAQAFEDLNARMAAARDAAPADPFERLKAIGLAYVAFALERPATYAMMFQPGYQGGAQGEMAQAGARCGNILTEAVAATHRPDQVDEQTGVALAWINVHGFVSLLAGGMIGWGDEGPTAQDMAERLLSLLRPAFSRDR